MSIRVMAGVFDLSISSTEKLVLLALADHARDDGTGAYPAVNTLARKTSLSRRGIQKILRRLEQASLIAQKGTVRCGRGETVEYRITLQTGKGEPGSPFTREKGRNVGRERANSRTQKREPGAPESSYNHPEPQAPPTPRTTGGEEITFRWGRETIAVKMNGRKRIMTDLQVQMLTGSRADDVVQFLNRKGFVARVVADSEVSTTGRAA
jgi:hypothetical protein